MARYLTIRVSDLDAERLKKLGAIPVPYEKDIEFHLVHEENEPFETGMAPDDLEIIQMSREELGAPPLWQVFVDSSTRPHLD